MLFHKGISRIAAKSSQVFEAVWIRIRILINEEYKLCPWNEEDSIFKKLCSTRGGQKEKNSIFCQQNSFSIVGGFSSFIYIT